MLHKFTLEVHCNASQNPKLFKPAARYFPRYTRIFFFAKLYLFPNLEPADDLALFIELL